MVRFMSWSAHATLSTCLHRFPARNSACPPRCNLYRHSGTQTMMIVVRQLTSYISGEGSRTLSRLHNFVARRPVRSREIVPLPDLPTCKMHLSLTAAAGVAHNLIPEKGGHISVYINLIDSTHSGSAAVTGGPSCCCMRRPLLPRSRSDCEPPRDLSHLVPALVTH
jgi:hypothetical protein